ncbi:unnamed protein product [Meloidogyne enterolobii]|uniref:Uncharacterized protein n=1 Tax=Meloidogyne enterolobii TaxID=390850 RepID=A0ACB1AIF9_MELEN
MEPLAEFDGSSAKGVKKISVKTDLNKAKESIQGRLTEIYFKEASAWSLITGYKNDEYFQNTINEVCERENIFIFKNTRGSPIETPLSNNYLRDTPILWMSSLLERNGLRKSA